MIFISIILTIIGLFLNQIILFDSIIIAIIGGVVCNQMWNIHPAICLVIAIVVFGLLFMLQNTTVGFWIIGVLMSAFWALMFGVIANSITKDVIWDFVVMGLGFIFMLILHLRARDG